MQSSDQKQTCGAAIRHIPFSEARGFPKNNAAKITLIKRPGKGSQALYSDSAILDSVGNLPITEDSVKVKLNQPPHLPVKNYT